MRVQSDRWFANYLLHIDNGTEEVNEDGDVRLPDEICVPYTRDSEKNLDTLIERIIPNLNANMTNKDYITQSHFNLKMINKFQGGEMVYIVSTRQLLIPITIILRSFSTH
jgi:ATP-dependent DNA helicase PIF1